VAQVSSAVGPRAIRAAGAVVALQGAAGIAAGLALAVRTVIGGHESATVGYGTAALFAVLGMGVSIGGVALIRSMRGGRGVAVVVQVVLLPVAWSLLTGSDQVLAGLLVGALAVLTLALLLCAPSRRWMAQQYDVATSEDDG